MKLVHFRWNGEGQQYDCDTDIGEGGYFVPIDQLDRATKRQNRTAFIAALIGAVAGVVIATVWLGCVLMWVYRGHFW